RRRGTDPRQAGRARPRGHPAESRGSGRGVRRPPEDGRAGLSVLRPFALHRPRSLEEAAEFLAEHRGEAALYAGGTELLLLLKEGLLRVGNLIDLKRVPGLGDITAEDGHVVIGAIARHRTVERSLVLRAACPIVAAAAQHVANVRVRTVGTVGGNLAFADPHTDLATLFLALDGSGRPGPPGRGVWKRPPRTRSSQRTTCTGWPNTSATWRACSCAARSRSRARARWGRRAMRGIHTPSLCSGSSPFPPHPALSPSAGERVFS